MEPITLPSKKYEIIYADPPWTYNDKASAGNRGAGFKYSLMTIDQIESLPVSEIAADNCVLFMWHVAPMPEEALRVVKAWGFTLKTMKGFTWAKQNKKSDGFFMGMGNWTRANTEDCLIAVKGKPKRIDASVRQLVISRLRGHSQKPDEVRSAIVQLMGDLPRIELFARQTADGWDSWGNEL